MDKVKLVSILTQGVKRHFNSVNKTVHYNVIPLAFTIEAGKIHLPGNINRVLFLK